MNLMSNTAPKSQSPLELVAAVPHTKIEHLRSDLQKFGELSGIYF